METLKIKANLRTELGKKATKHLRREEKVPCVLYGGEKNVHFTALEKSFKGLVYTPSSFLLNIDIDGTEYKAIKQDIQFHPVTDKIIHIDFLQISDDKPVTIPVPVHLEGFAIGVKAGGKLQQNLRTLKVRALTKDLPDFVTVDVTDVALGKTVKVGSLQFDNLELLNNKDSVVAAVKLTRAARGAAGAGEEGAEGTEETAAE